MTKREAWFMAYLAGLQKYAGMAAQPDTNRSGPERSADLAERDADEALKRLEQREREGRFGPPSDQGSFTLHAAKMGEDLQHWHDHAMKAEAEVGRLSADAEAHRAEMVALRALHADNLDRADKAESLLKEALAALVDNALIWHKKTDVLARARQEGFEP